MQIFAWHDRYWTSFIWQHKNCNRMAMSFWYGDLMHLSSAWSFFWVSKCPSIRASHKWKIEIQSLWITLLVSYMNLYVDVSVYTLTNPLFSRPAIQVIFERVLLSKKGLKTSRKRFYVNFLRWVIQEFWVEFSLCHIRRWRRKEKGMTSRTFLFHSKSNLRSKFLSSRRFQV